MYREADKQEEIKEDLPKFFAIIPYMESNAAVRRAGKSNDEARLGIFTFDTYEGLHAWLSERASKQGFRNEKIQVFYGHSKVFNLEVKVFKEINISAL